MTRLEGPGMLRIGELSRRVGVSDHVLRAWERRYGLLQPVRSDGGFRLYSRADEARVRRMQSLLAEGLSAAEAARAAVREEPAFGPEAEAALPAGDVAELGADLLASLEAMNEPAAQGLLDRLLTDLTLETVLRDVLLPTLQRLGERWEAGEVSVTQEHFASQVVRGRLSGLARGWGAGRGPHALLACAPGEQHDLAVLMFGIVLGRCGWRIGYFGADTPASDLTQVVTDMRPELVLVAAVAPERFAPLRRDLRRIAAVAPLAIGGAGATRALADAVGATLLLDDPVTAALKIGGSERPA